MIAPIPTCGILRGSTIRASTVKLPHITIFPDFKHRNRKLFGVLRTHHLLQHFNDVAEEWFSSSFRF
jgi:hypothetical protein